MTDDVTAAETVSRPETASGTETEQTPSTPLTERIEAILLIIDEPIGLVALAAAVGSPVPAVRQSLETLVDDYDGRGQGPGAASSCARSVGAGASTCARTMMT